MASRSCVVSAATLLGILAIASWANQALAQTAVPADQCMVEVAAPADATLSVDGRDYGKERKLTFNKLRPGQPYRSRFQVRFSDGTVEERLVDLEAGRRVQLVMRGRGANLPELVVQTRRFWDMCYDLSPDGKYLAVGGNDNTGTVWEVATGNRVRLFQGNSLGVTNHAFHPDGKHLAMGVLNEVILWDMVRGERVGICAGASAAKNPPYFHALEFTKDGRYLVGFTYEFIDGAKSILHIWEFETGKTLHALTEAAEMKALAVSPDGRYCATGSEKRSDPTELNVREISTGRTVHTLKGPSQLSGVAYSAAGDELIVSTDGTPATIQFLKIGSGETVRSMETSFTNIKALAPLPDGKRLLVGGHITKNAGTNNSEYTHKAEMWQLEPAKVLHTYPFDFFVETVAAVPGQEQVLINDTVFRMETGERVRKIQGVSDPVHSVRFGRDGRHCLANDVVWDLAKGAPVRQVANALALSPDGRGVIAATNKEEDFSVKLWDLRSGRLAQNFVGHTEGVSVADVSPDGRLLASGGADKQVILWDLPSGRKLFSLPHEQSLRDVRFTGDGRLLVTSTGFHYMRLFGPPCQVRIWDTRRGQMIRQLESPKDHHSSSISLSGRYSITGGDKTAILWDATSGRALRTLSGHTAEVHAVALAPGDRLALTCSRDGTAILWSVPAGERLQTLRGHSGWVDDVDFTPDGTRFVTGSGDGARIWGVTGGQDLARLMATEGDNKDQGWLVATAEGLFDGSLGGRQAVTYRVGGGLNVVPVDRFFQDFYRPGLLAEIWRGNYPLPGAALGAAKSPVVRIVSPAKGGAVTTAKITLEVEVTDQGGGVKGPWLKHNGANVIVPGEPKTAGKLVTRTFEVALIEGKNELEVCAASADGSWESEPARLTVEQGGSVADGQFHLVAVGINQYAETSMNLKFAASDAEAMAALFRKRGPELYGQDRIHVVQLLNDRATKEGIRSALADIAKKAKPQDTLCLFLAGHGTMAGQRYFFIPHEFKSSAKDLTEDIRQQGLSGDELDDLVARIPALKRIVIYDTCQSGGAIPLARTARDAFAFRRVVEAMGRTQGSFILAATAATDDAQEVPDLGHGVLTYTLLAALGSVDRGPLKNRKTRATDNMVLVRDWFGFAQDEVPSLTRTFFGEEQFVRFTGSGANFPILPSSK